MSDAVVPDGWSRTSLGAIGRYLNGRAFKRSEWSKTGRPIIRIQDLTGTSSNPNFFEGEVQDRYVVRRGDFLISWSATLGAYIWDGPEGVLNQHIFKVESDIDQKFHFHLVRDRIAELQRNAHGSGMVHVTKGVFESTPVVVPDEQEVQRRIADVIDRSDGLQRSASERLDGARHAVERFRQTVLAAASSGRLTADWRDANADGSQATDLLDAIRGARLTVRKAVEPEEMANPDGEETPESWCWVRFGSVIGELRNGVSKAPAMEPPGRPMLRISAARPRSIDLGDLRYLRDDSEKWNAFRLRDGDLLFTRYNGSISLLGVCGMVRGLDGRVILHPDKLMRVRFDHALIEPEYVEIFFASPNARRRMMAGSVSSAGQQGVSGATVKAQPLVLPPLAEQREIISRVNELMKRSVEVDRRIEAALATVAQTSRAVRTKALRGDLTVVE